MPIDPEKLPAELLPYAGALDLRTAHVRADLGWLAHDWPAPVVPLIPGAPPYDGVYRASWVSPGVCLRLDLDAVPEPLRTHLRAQHPERLGDDGAYYVFGIAHASQRRNREDALLALALEVAAFGADHRR